MDVTLIRHGTAEDHATNDFERALTAGGRAEAERAADRLVGITPPPDSIISSPLVRARQSAELVARRLGFPEPITIDAALVPDAPATGVRDLLAGLGERRHVVLVGHEPILSAACALLTGGPVSGLRRAEVVSMRSAEPPAGRDHQFAIRFRG
jgi:phosphohistidine phosphatase